MSKKSLKQIAYNIIKNKILTCEYKPNLFLNEDAVCMELSMSRTPVRDALSNVADKRFPTQLFDCAGFLFLIMFSRQGRRYLHEPRK